MVLRYSKETVSWPHPRPLNQSCPGNAADGVAVESGVIVTRSILSRRTFWTFA